MTQPGTLPELTALVEYIQLSARVEDAVARIYDHFGTIFAERPELSHFWKLSAEAERYHAATIRLYELTVSPDLPVDETCLPKAIDETRRHLDEILAVEEACKATPPTPEGAIDVAIRLESNAAEAHGRTQFSFLFPALKDLFVRLAEEDQAHRTTFEAARARLATLQPAAPAAQ